MSVRKIIWFASLFICNYATAQYAKDTIRLYFDLNIRTLNKMATGKIDSLIYNDIILPGEDFMIVGYADYLGTEKYNQNLSEDRAKNVETYIELYGIDKKNIKLCIGKGKVEREGITGAQGFPTDRRVDIVIRSKRAIKTNKEKVATKQTQPVNRQTTQTQQQTPSHNELSEITKVEAGKTFILRNIYFYPNSHDITPSIPTLIKLYQVLVDNPTLKIKIEGHVCCISGYPDAYDIDSHDNNLSINRAKAIYEYLIRRGISANRLSYQGFGRSRPLVPIERDEDDAAMNRRVEIRVISK
jgi:outer membrane protein OmpA-like peptidoglycan-associated protein